MAAPVIFGSGNVPQKADTRWTLLVKICNATIAGGGGAGAGGVFSADYSGVAPAFVPTTAGAIAIDSVTGRQWQYYNGAWN